MSFLGWVLLACLFTFGIGMFWVVPYMTVARAAFYEQLRLEQGYVGQTVPEA